MAGNALAPAGSWRMRAVWVGAAWTAAAAASAALQGRVDLGSQALPLVAAAAATAIWWSALPSMAACVVAVLGFNWAYVPPRGTLGVELPRHMLLLATMLAVSGAVALLMARQRRLAQREADLRQREQQVQAFGELLRAAPDGHHAIEVLQQALAQLRPAAWRAAIDPGASRSAGDALLLGRVSADERTGLWMCMTQSVAFGPGTGRYVQQIGRAH